MVECRLNYFSEYCCYYRTFKGDILETKEENDYSSSTSGIDSISNDYVSLNQLWSNEFVWMTKTFASLSEFRVHGRFSLDAFRTVKR